jgi:hypothetical protein
MYRFLVALFLLYVSISVSALAHSGNRAGREGLRTRRAALLPQTDESGRSDYPGLPQGKSSEALSRVPRRAGEPRTTTMALPFSVDAFSSRNKGIGDLKNLLVKISLGKAHARDQRSTARRSPCVR